MNQADELKNEIARFKRCLGYAEDKLKQIYAACQHEWSNSIYDPIHHKQVNFPASLRYSRGGYVPYDEITYEQGYTIPAKTEDRWRRTCSACGKIEYTNNFEEQKNINKFPRWST